MASGNLSKVMDAEKESMYGYVFGVSGPGKDYYGESYELTQRRLWVVLSSGLSDPLGL